MPLDFDTVKTLVPKKKKHLVTPEVVEEINALADDPDYGEEFLELYAGSASVLENNPRATMKQYKNALKFYSLVENGLPLVRAYMQVFPERVLVKEQQHPESDPAELLAYEASRYNRSQLVNDIRKLACISIKLVHRNLLHEAVLKQAELMRNARSEMVRQKASETLIRELKPEEESTLNVNVNDGRTDAIQELRNATIKLAQTQHELLKSGMPLKEIAESKIIEASAEIVDE